MLDQLVNATILYPIVMILFVGSAVLGFRFGVRVRREEKSEDMTTLTASALGLLALLLAFSLSHALSRYETRRALILDEANAIGSTAHFASMLPTQAQGPILNLLREYVTVRISFGRPYDPAKLERDIAKSRELLDKLWQCAVEVSEPSTIEDYGMILSRRHGWCSIPGQFLTSGSLQGELFLKDRPRQWF